VKIDVPKTL